MVLASQISHREKFRGFFANQFEERMIRLLPIAKWDQTAKNNGKTFISTWISFANVLKQSSPLMGIAISVLSVAGGLAALIELKAADSPRHSVSERFFPLSGRE
jgi:hypothetical protein